MQAGTYFLTGRSFIVAGTKYLIASRKQVTTKKPKTYLMAIEPIRHYVSSLFPIVDSEGEVYHFDYERELYKLEVTEATVAIEKL